MISSVFIRTVARPRTLAKGHSVTIRGTQQPEYEMSLEECSPIFCWAIARLQ